MNKKKKLTTILLSIFSIAFLGSFNRVPPNEESLPPIENTQQVNAHFFYSNNCSSCKELENYLNEEKEQFPNLNITKYLTDQYVSFGQENEDYETNNTLLFSATETLLNNKTNEVPFFALGGRGFLGFNKAVKYEINYFLNKYSNEEHVDVINKLILGQEIVEGDLDKTEINIFDLPIIGIVDAKTVSLGLISVVLGLVDGFNPCAMWVLLFLISLLLQTKDRKRILLMGGVFILTSGLFYFALLMAWISAVSFIAANTIFRVIVGVFAIGAGGFNLYQFIKALVRKEDGCEITSEKQKSKLIERVKKVVSEQKLVLALLGIIVLALIVNMIELACSTGFPILFANILAINNVAGWSSLGYVLIYILFFILDDIIVLTIVMLTLKIKVVSNKVAKYNHLIGGIIMVLIGILVIFFPNILQFSF